MTDKPGRELDKLVALAIRWRREKSLCSIHYGEMRWYPSDVPNTALGWTDPPPFSADDGEAVKALEEFYKRGKNVCGYEIIGDYEKRHVYLHLEDSETGKDLGTTAMESSHDLAHAICLAIVEAAGVKG